MTVDEVAGILRVPKRAVYRLILDDELAAVKEGDLSILVSEDALNKYLRGAVVSKK